ncbi:NTP/NDP exchange transporter [Roseisolibacter agri]|uniref:MFS transporter n=1 Tax=Roseisolibacter agri TaxID=2014610 RepID=A0AA37V7C3_9BACT|nr:MFS transporter [Roseisolibacter agri]GLC26426.1 MFS transporter [Roseisolibacter agri]
MSAGVTTRVSDSALARAIGARGGEGKALLWSCAYYFLVLTAYYILRPIRDEMGVAGGVENLAWLFTGTLAGMLLLHPLYTWIVARLTRRRFIALTYRFFIANLVIFYLLLRAAGGDTPDPARAVWIGRAFFIWTSVFNLFVVSVFWSFTTDMYRPAQSRRLFGVIAVGGTLGSILGSSITSALAGTLGAANLLLVSGLFLEAAAWAARALETREPELAAAAQADVAEGERDRAAVTQPEAKDAVIGGGVADGVRHVLASPYLLGIAVVMLFFTISSTFLYFQQSQIAKDTFGADSAGRTQFFANVDLLVNALTLVAQVFLTGRVLRWLGVGIGLAFLPAVSLLGFAAIGIAPVLPAVVVLQVLRRVGNFAIQRPAREVLYTVLPRTDKYKSKNFNDTFVYRLGDQVGAWSATLIGWLGFGLSGLSWTMVPLSAAWLALAFWLGARYRGLQAGAEPAPRPALEPRPNIA